MLRVTQALIDAVHTVGGSYYLPYRLHARPDQLAAIYPRAVEFAARKRHYDPDLVFPQHDVGPLFCKSLTWCQSLNLLPILELVA